MQRSGFRTPEVDNLFYNFRAILGFFFKNDQKVQKLSKIIKKSKINYKVQKSLKSSKFIQKFKNHQKVQKSFKSSTIIQMFKNH